MSVCVCVGSGKCVTGLPRLMRLQRSGPVTAAWFPSAFPLSWKDFFDYSVAFCLLLKMVSFQIPLAELVGAMWSLWLEVRSVVE